MTLRDPISCDLLYKMYVDKGKSMKTIANELGCGTSFIQRRCVECEIPVRKRRSMKQIKQMSHIEKKSLERMYVDQKKTEREIGIIIGCDPRTVHKMLLSYEINLRHARYSISDKISKSMLNRMYTVKRRTAISIAKEFGCSSSTIGDLLRKYKIKTCFQLRRERITKPLLIKMYVTKKMQAKEIAKKLDCAADTIFSYLHKYGIPLRKDYSKAHSKYRKWCVEEGKKRKKKMWEMLGGCCAICRRVKDRMYIHHMYYKPNDVIHDDYSKNRMQYYVELYLLVTKERRRFLLLCPSCHTAIGKMGMYTPENMPRLLELVKEMDSMRKKHSTQL